MSLTAPFDPGTPARLPFTHGQRVEVVAVTSAGARIPIQLQAGTLTFDERRAPRVDLTLTARVPEDQATLDALDPRAGVRLEVRAGYTRSDRPREDDVHLVADLGLRSRYVRRPGNTLELRAASDEALILDDAPTADLVLPAGTSLAAALRQLLTAALPGAVVVEDTLPTGPTLPEPLTITPEQDYWSHLDDLLDRFGTAAGPLGADLFDDGLRRWHLRPRPALAAATPAHALAVGPRGTVTGADTGLERDEWHNACQLVYRWDEVSYVIRYASLTPASSDDGELVEVHTPRVVVGTAAITSGPFAPPASPRRVFRDTRDVATTQAQANAAAAAVLARRAATGRTLSGSAIAAWWLRPGHTTPWTLPTGPTEAQLLVAVAFDLTAGSMRLATRLPDDTTTITPGA